MNPDFVIFYLLRNQTKTEKFRSKYTKVLNSKFSKLLHQKLVFKYNADQINSEKPDNSIK